MSPRGTTAAAATGKEGRGGDGPPFDSVELRGGGCLFCCTGGGGGADALLAVAVPGRDIPRLLFRRLYLPLLEAG